MLAAGLAMRTTPRTMLRRAQTYSLDADLAPSNFGLDGGRGLKTWIRRFLGLAKKTTLLDIHRVHGTTLRIVGTNVDARCAVYFSHETHPDMDVLTALRISCSVPGVFAAVRYKGALYVDGAVADPFPIPSHTSYLGVRCASQLPTPVTSVQDFVMALVASSRMPPVASHTVLVLDAHGVNPLDFGMPPDALHTWYRDGARQAAAFVKKNQ